MGDHALGGGLAGRSRDGDHLLGRDRTHCLHQPEHEVERGRDEEAVLVGKERFTLELLVHDEAGGAVGVRVADHLLASTVRVAELVAGTLAPVGVDEHHELSSGELAGGAERDPAERDGPLADILIARPRRERFEELVDGQRRGRARRGSAWQRLSRRRRGLLLLERVRDTDHGFGGSVRCGSAETATRRMSGSRKITRSIGTLARIRASAPSIATATSAAVAPSSTATFAATSTRSWPRCMVRRWMRLGIPCSTTAASIASWCSGSAASPSSMEFISTARNEAMTTSSTPMAAEPIASQRPSLVIRVIDTPNSASTRPTSAPMSSSRMTGSSGDRDRRTKRNSGVVPRTWFASRTAVRSEKLSITIATTSTSTGTQCQEVIGCGSENLCQASYRAKQPPRVNRMIETMKAYTYRLRQIGRASCRERV